MILHSTWYGSFVLERTPEGFRTVEALPAPADPKELAREIEGTSRGGVLPREEALISRHPVDEVTEHRLERAVKGARTTEVPVDCIPGPAAMGLDLSVLSEATRAMAARMPEEGPMDWNVLSMVGALNDIESSMNLVKERISEWTVKYWPGAERLVDRVSFIESLRDVPDLSSVYERLLSDDPSALEGVAPPEGVSLDLSGLSPLGDLVLSLKEARERMELCIASEMLTVAPNLSEVVGPIIGARLIHSAGGLERLSRLPASTVQVLGAEKMFFKFLKEGGKPPKHGVLFQHPWVHSLPAQKRGRMARSLASAASIASRLDRNGGRGVGPLKERLERRATEIRASDKKRAVHGGRQPPFREGWWADKGGPGRGLDERGDRRRRRDGRGRRSG